MIMFYVEGLYHLSHSFTVLSLLPEIIYLPSGENSTEKMLPLCFTRVLISFPKTISQIFILPSELPDTKYLPSGEISKEKIPPYVLKEF